eukprot:2254075-Rhodomonas_salina.2
MPTALLIYAILFMLIFLVVVMNGWEYVLLRREFLSRKVGAPHSQTQLLPRMERTRPSFEI